MKNDNLSERVLATEMKSTEKSWDRINIDDSRIELSSEKNKEEFIDKLVDTLKEAIRILPNSSKFAVCLAEIQMDRRLYEDVIETCNKAAAGSAAFFTFRYDSYLLLLKTMAQDALLHRKIILKEPIYKGDVSDLSDTYEKLMDEFPEIDEVYGGKIRMRIGLLKFIDTDE